MTITLDPEESISRNAMPPGGEVLNVRRSYVESTTYGAHDGCLPVELWYVSIWVFSCKLVQHNGIRNTA